MKTTDDAIRELAEKWMPMVRYKDKSRFIECLTALIEEYYVNKEDAGYPKAFIEWIGDDCSPCYLERKDDDEGYGKWIVFKRNSMEHEVEFDTLDELYQYWKENEQ